MPHSDRSLVLRAQSGDRAAFDELLRRIQQPLHRYVTTLVGASADDVVQDVLILIVRKIAWLADPALFRPWAFRIASREAFRALRKRRAVVEEPVDETLPAADGEPPDALLRDQLLGAVERLPPAARAVITLHYLEDMPLADVAAVLDVSVGTVKSRLAYGLAHLRRKGPQR